MATRFRKSRKKRGTRILGWGRAGQHRKSGGKGNAGMDKHRWSWVVKYEPDHFGYHGFYRHPRPTKVERWINVGDLDTISGSNDGEILDLASMGFEKLLGGGTVTGSYRVIVPSATSRAVEKVERAGGRVEVPGRRG